MAPNLGANTRINLTSAVVLLLDGNHHGLQLLSQIVSGFGARSLHKCATFEEANDVTRLHELDLIITEGEIGEKSTADFISSLRRSNLEPNRFVPIVVVSGHTPRSMVIRMRDSGANFVICKPLNPEVILKRIIWISEENRPFIETDTYVGPDRRFQNMGPPPGSSGRRKTDLDENVGEATTPNMSQEDIDNLMKPQKVSV